MSEYNHEYFVPDSFVVGVDASKGVGFPTMKKLAGNWANLGAFEKTCGFKPHEQQDKAKELEKTVKQAVREVGNEPTPGFRLVSFSANAYAGLTNLLDHTKCAVLEDPRGWKVTVPAAVLKRLLDLNGWNLSGGVLTELDLVYAWPAAGAYENGMFTLVPAGEEERAAREATRAAFDGRRAVKYLKPSEFRPGFVYSSKTSKAAGRRFMYAGVRDVYSPNAQRRALGEGYGKLGQYLSMQGDATSKGAHVFYCLDSDCRPLYDVGSGSAVRRPGAAPYFATKNLSKLFETEEPPEAAAGFFVRGDPAVPVSLESVLADMDKSVMFRRIEPAGVWADVGEDLLAGELAAQKRGAGAAQAFPFGSGWNMWLSLPSYGSGRRCYVCEGKDGGFRAVEHRREYCGTTSHEIGSFATLAELVATLRPRVRALRFEGGGDVPVWQCAYLNG